jgi:hypothetical protein
VFFKTARIKIHRTVILTVVLNRRKAWSLALREELRLRVSQNRVLRKAFGPNSDKVTGEWRRLHKEELSTPNLITFRDQI